MCWYGNIYDPISDTGILVQEGQVDLAAKAGLADGELNLVVGLVPDYEGRIWFATEGNIDEKSPKRTDKHVVTPMVGYYDPRNGVVSVTGVPPIPNYIPAMIANSISSSPAGGDSRRDVTGVVSVQGGRRRFDNDGLAESVPEQQLSQAGPAQSGDRVDACVFWPIDWL